MPGSAPAGSAATSGTVAPVTPEAPSADWSLAETGAASTRIRTTVAKAVAGAADRRRAVAVVGLPLVCETVCETAQATERYLERRPNHAGD
jgi:hypothetical protein